MYVLTVTFLRKLVGFMMNNPHFHAFSLCHLGTFQEKHGGSPGMPYRDSEYILFLKLLGC